MQGFIAFSPMEEPRMTEVFFLENGQMMILQIEILID